MKRNLIWLSLALITGTAVVAIGARSGYPAGSTDGLTVHEWGTFTSVFGSDGSILSGLELEEEALPAFVYALDTVRGRPQVALEPAEPGQNAPSPFALLSKGFNRPLRNVKVRMETPVLYFYTGRPLDARVAIGFNGGSISQWYPARSQGEIAQPVRYNEAREITQGLIDFAQPYQGSIEWKVRVEPRTEITDFEVMKPGETATWLHPRAPKSSLVRTSSGETESYLFYRGLGNFEQPVRFQVNVEGRLRVDARDDVPWMLVLQNLDSGVRFWHGQPAALADTALDAQPARPLAEVSGEIYRHLRGALIEAGLFADEADAMLRTWWHSYIDGTGLRAFWIVPREFTDAILPIEIEPRPAHLERVLLGRSEILTPEFEQTLLKAYARPEEQNPYRHHRYFRAYQDRVERMKP